MAKEKKTTRELTSEEKLARALVPVEEQPYGVPENWCWVRFGLLIELISGRDAALSECNDKGIGIPYILGASNINNNTFSVERWIESPQVISKKNDILLSVKGTIGKLYLQQEDSINISRQIMAIRPLKKLNVKFIYYFLLCICNELQEAGNGLIPSISRSDILEKAFPLPPLFEQQRIVDRIENLFAKLDEAKEKAQAVVNSFGIRRTMILYMAFIGELTREWRKQHKIDFDDWNNATLNDIAEYKKGPFGSSITKAMFVPKATNTYKVYEQGNAIRKTLDYGHYYITEEKYNELKGFAIQSGDIIISCAGTIGEVYKIPEGCEAGIINQALMRVRLFSNIIEEFFIYYFGEVLKGDVNDKANGTAIKNIPPFKIMKAMPIQLPPIAEQEAIVRILEDILSKEKHAQEAAEAVLAQIDTMKKAILARAFRGELGTNDPEEESAEVLLRQII